MVNSGAQIGAHLAGLNLFREPDGTVEITISDPTGVMREYEALTDNPCPLPIDYAEGLIIEAAERMKARRAAR